MDNQQLIIGIVVIFSLSYIPFLMKIRKDGEEHAEKFSTLSKSLSEEFNTLAITFNKSISELNLLVTQINTTLDFVRKEIDKQSERNTVHGKEIDIMDKTVTVNSALLKKLEERVDEIEKRLK